MAAGSARELKLAASLSRLVSDKTMRAVKRSLLRAPAPIRDRLGLALFRGYELYTSRRRGHDRIAFDNGLPVPPARLRAIVIGSHDPQRFLSSGQAENQMLRATLVRAGRPAETLETVLDWGCGCGRLARWWSDLSLELYACDYNQELVAWVRDSLPFVRAAANQLAPPLPYGDQMFDFVYALSVFTHLSDDNARAWLAEIKRVLRPEGLFLFTTHGTAYRHHLAADEMARFDAGEPVVLFDAVQGTNLCSAYHPRRWIERAAADADLAVLEVIEGADPPEPEPFIVQDRYLVRA